MGHSGKKEGKGALNCPNFNNLQVADRKEGLKFPGWQIVEADREEEEEKSEMR